jgi:energy-coupling factor transporter ATP-binding protein EcfA2
MTQPFIVMLSGKQGSGKTTLARALSNALLARGVSIAVTKFAEPLYAMHNAVRDVALSYGVPFAPKEGALLQWLGTEWGRQTKGEDVWINAARHQVAHLAALGAQVVLIDDMRFPNEFDAFGGDALRVRLDAGRELRRARADGWREYDDHPSEVALDGLAADGAFDLYFGGQLDGTGLGDAWTIDGAVNVLVEVIGERVGLRAVGMDAATGAGAGAAQAGSGAQPS